MTRADLAGEPRVYVVGDLAAVSQDGQRVRDSLRRRCRWGGRRPGASLRRVNGEPVEPFRYLDKGSFAVIGRGAAVGSIFSKLEVSGLIAWFIWATVTSCTWWGSGARIAVMFTWLYSYLTLAAHRAAHHLLALAAAVERGARRVRCRLPRSAPSSCRPGPGRRCLCRRLPNAESRLAREKQ